MRPFFSFSKKTSLFQYIVDVSSIIALATQCIDFAPAYSKVIEYVAITVIGLSIISLVIDIVNQKKKNKFKRSAIVKETQRLMINSTGKIVMFGGDLSWAENYLATIAYLSNNNQIVEIIFPKEKLRGAKKSV